MGQLKKKSKSRDLLFSMQSEGLVWNHDVVVYVNAVRRMASRVSVYLKLNRCAFFITQRFDDITTTDWQLIFLHERDIIQLHR